MTLHQLAKLRGLDALIQHEKERLEAMQDSAYSARSQRLDGMPRPGVGWHSDRTGDSAAGIVDESAKLRQQIAELERLRAELTDWIDRIKIPRIRLAILLKFCDGCTWQEVADKIGGTETEYAIAHAVRRYIEMR